MSLLQSGRSEVVVWPMNLVPFLHAEVACMGMLPLHCAASFAFKSPVACMPLAKGQGLLRDDVLRYTQMVT